jgi:hypothetical protein
MEMIKVNGKDVPLAQGKVVTTITNKKTGIVYQTDEEWKALKVPAEDIKRDVTVTLPTLDLFAKTK